MCLEVTSEYGGGVWELGHASGDVVADVTLSGDRVGVVPRRKVSAYEQSGSGARGADEDRSDASGEAGWGRWEFASVVRPRGGGFVGDEAAKGVL